METKELRHFRQGDVYTLKVLSPEKIKVTGLDPISNVMFDIGSELSMGINNNYAVDSIERRDHAGVFNDPATAKDAFYTAILTKINN